METRMKLDLTKINIYELIDQPTLAAYMGKGGESLGASEFIGEEKDKIWKNISERTNGIFHLPT